MSTRNKLAGILLGCSILLMTSHDVSAANKFPQIVLFSGMGTTNFEFVVKNSKNETLCQKTGVRLTVSTPPISCANLLNVKSPEKLNITIGPEANIKCAPSSKPIEFAYTPGDDISVVVKSAKTCVVTSK